jgi:folylpolyglutamate synthase/dihydropteroate synthase
MDVFSKKPLVILDGAHNPAGVEALCYSFPKIFGAEPILVVGIMKDKEWGKMAGIFSSKLKPSLVIATQPKNERSLKAEVLAKEFEKLGCDTFVEKNARKAVETAMVKALEQKKKVLAAGSLYLVGEILS